MCVSFNKLCYITPPNPAAPHFLPLSRDHARQLIEKYIGQPFFEYHDSTTPRMSREQLLLGLDWLQDHFHVILNVKDEPPTVSWVLETARMAVMR